MTTAAEWWAALTLETQARLRADPRGPVPDDLVGEITEAGRLVSGAWWPSVQSGPSGFYLPDDLAEYVEGAPDPERRKDEARDLIDKILHGVPEGRVDPEIAADLRLKLAQFPGEPDRALLEHIRAQMTGLGVPFDAVFPEDLAED